DVEEVISELIQTNFLNEERFAIAYTLGKFRMKNWGRLKIKQGLKLKRVSEKLITKALKQLDGDEYYITLTKVLEKKSALLKEKDPFKKRSRLFQYASGRGVESDLILESLRDLGF